MQHNFLTRLLLTLTLLVGFSPAVWADDQGEAARYAGFQALPAAQQGDVVFIGNSITHMMNWWEAFGSDHGIHGRGNSGCESYQIVDNLESMIAGCPAKAFLMIGTNDLGGKSIETVVANIKQICLRIRMESPETEVYCQSILPTSRGYNTKIPEVNRQVSEWIAAKNDPKLQYVDLFSLLKANDGLSIKNAGDKGEKTLSYDNLHLTPLGYRIWMEHIKGLVSKNHVIPMTDELKNLHGGQSSSWGARIATFGTMPVKNKDILMFGDDFIHYGEWHELMGSADFKDRGNGWQFFSTNLGGVKAAIVPGLSQTQDNVVNCGVQRQAPAAVCINAGGRNIMDNETEDQIKTAFLDLVNTARANVEATTPIFLMSIMPIDHAKNDMVKTLNAYMKELADGSPYIHYIDLYGEMTDVSDARISKYFHANYSVSYNKTPGAIHPYPTPLGYVKVANVIATEVNKVLHTNYQPISEETAQANINRFAARTIVGKAVGTALTRIDNVGTAPGQFPAASVAAAQQTIADVCKVLYDGTVLTEDAARQAILPLASIAQEVVMPNVSDERSQYYYTISDARSSKFITAASGVNTLTATATASGAANQQWKLTLNANGGYNIQNVLTGGYLNMTASTITTSADVPSKGWTLASVGDGYFTIVSGTDQLNNANGTGTTVHNWGGGNSGGKEDPGCYYRFVLAEEIVPPVILDPVLPYGEGSGLNNLMPRPQQVTVTGGTYTGSSITEVTVEESYLANLGAYDYVLANYDNEAYQLIVAEDGITIKAAKPIGFIRAKQTLRQLEQNGSYECCEIVDWPAFKVRAYMHDNGRSYISVDELKREIDLLSRFKVNTFHFHITDKQAFRFQSLTHPDVNTKFTRDAGKFYTQAECTDIEAYAAERGITVIPEIDMPGHSAQFTSAMGFSMETASGKQVLKDILRELATAFPKAPYIHIGGDETPAATKEFINEMGGFVINDLGRKVVVWNRYGSNSPKLVTPNDMNVNMLTNWATAGQLVQGIPNIDMRYFYINHFDVFADLAGAYRSLIFDTDKGNENVAGVSIGMWNDRYVDNEKQIIAQNNFYASILAMTERAWCGGYYKGNRHQYIEKGRAYIPNEGWEYDEFADWERRFLHYKSTWLKDEPIPYVKQTNIRWNITPSYDNGGDGSKKFDIEDAQELTVQPGSTFATGAGIWLNHIWAGTVNGIFPSAQSKNQTRYAWTYVYSPVEQDVAAQIEFYNYSRSETGRGPVNGNWDRYGSKVWLNGEELHPNWEWTNNGANCGEETVLGNLNFPARTPLPVHLKQGWNKVLLKLPYVNADQNRPNKWQYTFVFTDTEGKNAVEGLVYSPTRSTNGTEDFTVPELPRVAPTPYTEADPHVYRIKSRRGGYYIKDNGKGAALTTNASATTDSDKFLWKFVERSQGVYDIVSYSTGGYLSPAPVTSNQLGCVEAKPSEGWTLANGSTETYFIVTSGTTQLHNDKANKVLNWGYSNEQFNTTDDGCEFIFEEVEEFGQPTTPDVEEGNVYYTITNHQKDGKTYAFYVEGSQLKVGDVNVAASEFGDKALFVKEAKGSSWAFKNKASGEYLVFCGSGNSGTNNNKGVLSTYDANFCDFTLTPNSSVTDGVIISGKRKDKSSGTFVLANSGAFDAWSGTDVCWRDNYSNVFVLGKVVEETTETYVTITNHQQDGKTHVFYVADGQLKIAPATTPAEDLGDAALFTKEEKNDGKYVFKNKATNQYLVFRGLNYGTNGDKGVVNAYDPAYCDFTLTPNNDHVQNGFIITGKRSNNSEGTYIVKTGGTFDAWSGATKRYDGTYSNIFTFEEVSVAVPTIDYIIDKDHGSLYNGTTENASWNGTWKSSQQPVLKFIAYDNTNAVTNNMTWDNTTIQLETGKRAPCTYTIAAPEGYVVDSYSFDFTAKTATSNTLTVGGTEYATSQTAKHAEVTGVNDQTASFTLAGQNGTGTLLTNFVVKLRKIGAATEPDVLFTTEDEAAAGNYRWVRVTNVRNPYSINAGAEAELHSQATDFTNEGELFALVGTEQSFKLYSRTAEKYFGYSATGGGSAVTKDAATKTFKLVNNTTNEKPGLNIVPTGNEGQSFNMHGGAGKDIKFYNSGDPGSTWKITLVNKEVKGGISLNGEPTSDLNKLIGKINITVGTTSGETLVKTDNIADKAEVTYYVNERDRLSVSAGYTFRGYTAPTIDGMNVTYSVDETNKAQYLFYSTGAEHPYRIPSITRTKSGRLIAFSDYRFGGGDIGAGRVDIVARTSDDNGATWSAERTILQGDGNSQSRTCGFGDAASVADWESDDVMLMCCSAPNGGTCWKPEQRGVVAISHNGGETWETPVDIKDQICNATGSLLDGTNIVNYFVGSGKLHQSRYIKVGSHYRVYAPLFTTPGSGYNNYVVYTDNFGETWHLLGDKGTPCVVNGNEPKCEELPDGSVIISSRVNNSRYYNVFTYDKSDNDDYSKGSWGQRVNGCNSGDSGTDGEILITKAVRKSDGQLVTIALQSMPNSGRNNVTIWYKELSSDPAHQFTSSEFAGAWTVGKQVSNTSSAYSTMCMQDDGRIAFFFEEGPAGYEMVYMPLTISEATGGAYGPDFWTIGHAAKAVKMTEDGNCTLREVLDIERYLLNPAK